MFQHDSLPTRIFAYDAVGVTFGADIVADQLRLAQKYRNDWIAVELRRREAVAKVIAAHAPEIPRLEADVDAAVDRVKELEAALKARSAATRTRAKPTAAERRALSEARARRAAAKAELKAAKAAFWADPAVPPLMVASDEACHAAQLAVRAAASRDAGLYWSTYLMVERSYAKIRKGAPPEFRKWRGGKLARQVAAALEVDFAAALDRLPDPERLPGGAVTVQLQGGLTWDEALRGDDTQLRLEPAAAPGRMIAWIRVGTVPGGRRPPIWAKAEFHCHRTPPPGAVIKWAHLHRGRTNGPIRWRMLFEVAHPDGWAAPADAAPAGAGRCGVDINWRSLPGGLRVATAVGTDGVADELWIPRALVDRWTKSASLQSIRKRNFNAIRDALAAWIAAHRDALPPWFLALTAGMPLWKSLTRLEVVARLWRDLRFPGDDRVVAGMDAWRRRHRRLTLALGAGPLPLYDEVEAWRRHDRHLAVWMESNAAKAVRIRRDLYRKFAARLRRLHGAAVLEKIDWKKIEARQPPDKDDPIAPRVYKRMAAPGLLAELIREAMTTTNHPPEDTTRRCHACGTIDDVAAARSIVHTCSGCGATWDIDLNAALNLRDGLPEARGRAVG